MHLSHAARQAIIALALPLVLGACGDPLGDLDRLSDVDLPQDASAAALAPPPEDQATAPGFLNRILNRTLNQGPDLLPASVDDTLTELPLGSDVEGAALSETEADALPPETELPLEEDLSDAVPARRGLAGLLSRLAPAPATPSTGLAAGPRDDLAFDEVATVCGVSARSLGSVIGQASGYTIYDTDTGSLAQRTHYVTGFDDGCARQFRAALILFGDVGTHEVIRYSDGTEDIPFTSTDTAYEEIKARVCRVSAGQPCGQALDRLARDTTFLTVYETFGTNSVWVEVLLSGGDVIAIARKGV
jgi:hypothetical protein